MSDIVISVENLSKRYRLGVIGTGTFYGDLKRWWARRRGMPDPFLKVYEADHNNRDGDFVWALRDVSFRVRRGEALGIIGPNGAGKSTLLKILSQITAPTTGVVKIKGKIASLLEVGTGFHPELTGRENVYLNGAIMGMSRAEVDRKFDEIVDFSGVEKFIDTPVKRYSSGMYVRLAFAVAAHLEPDILVIDEVLAVGDADFQKKCLGKMGDVAAEGRTVIFVSHRMEAIERLCSRVMLFQQGSIALDGMNVREIIDEYLLDDGGGTVGSVWENSGDEFDNEWFKPLRVEICNDAGEVLTTPVRNSEEIFLRIEGDVRWVNKDLAIGYYLFSEKSHYPVYYSQHNDGAPVDWPKIRKGLNVIKTRIPGYLLNEGLYTVSLVVHLRTGLATKFRIVHPDERKIQLSFEISSVVTDSTNWIKRRGVIAPVLEWMNA